MDPAESPPPEGTPQEPVQITPPRRAMRKRAEEAPDEGANLASAIVFLTNLYSKAQNGEAAVPTAEQPSERAQSVLQAKRLSRSGGTGEAGTAEPGARPETDAAGAVLRPMKPRVARAPRPRRRWGKDLAWFAAICLGLCGVVGAFRWWQARPVSNGKTENVGQPVAGSTSLPVQATVSDGALQIAKQALEAMEKGDFALAAGLFVDARSRRIFLPGACYQAALVAFRLGDGDQASKLLGASIDANEAVPQCQYLRAAMAAAKGDYRSAVDRMAEAARVAPFDPRYYFYWGECLRRQGKPLEAVARFEEALRCRPASTDAELIIFKLNLARVEAGNDPEFQADLAGKLAQEPVSANTLLLGAADEITRSNPTAATPYLQRAAPLLPPAAMAMRLRDYLFRLSPNEKDLVAQWAALTQGSSAEPGVPREKAPLVDPATRGLADSDPATW